MVGTVAAARAALRRRFAAAGIPTPDVDADLLVAHVLGVGRGALGALGRADLRPDAARALEVLASRRAAREPLQLLLGTVGFRHLALEVLAGVFVPRPETEVLVDVALARLRVDGVVVEPCTGTGAVALSLAAEGAAADVVATDRSPAAVALARANAARLGLDVTVLEGDLLEPVPERLRGRVDVLVCNPPYLAEHELAHLEPEVVDWDPVDALVSGATGFEVVDRLLDEAPTWLAPAGALVVEVDPARAPSTAARFAAAGFVDVEVVRDLAGRERIVAGRRP